MDGKSARRLKADDRVSWLENDDDCGTVKSTGFAAISIEWDNGEKGTLHPDDCENLSCCS